MELDVLKSILNKIKDNNVYFGANFVNGQRFVYTRKKEIHVRTDSIDIKLTFNSTGFDFYFKTPLDVLFDDNTTKVQGLFRKVLDDLTLTYAINYSPFDDLADIEKSKKTINFSMDSFEEQLFMLSLKIPVLIELTPIFKFLGDL